MPQVFFVVAAGDALMPQVFLKDALMPQVFFVVAAGDALMPQVFFLLPQVMP